MDNLFVNTRCLTAQKTGVRRYAESVLSIISDQMSEVHPKKSSHGVKGHLWEQFLLPRKIPKNGLLWSPANTGPIFLENQVISLMDASTLDHPEWFSCEYAAWYQFTLPRLAKRARHILTISEYSKERLMETCDVPEEKITVTYCGIDKNNRPTTPEETTRIKGKFNLEKPYVLSVCSLEPRKNLGRLLNAWKELGKKDIELVLVGGGGRIFRDRGFDEVPEGVKLIGRVEDADLPALYSGAIGLAYPTLLEGFGLPALEAMACGCPVFTSKVSSLPEVCGDAAIYCNPLDEISICEGLQSLFDLKEEERTLLIDKGLNRARLFSWEKCAQETLTVLKNNLTV